MVWELYSKESRHHHCFYPPNWPNKTIYRWKKWRQIYKLSITKTREKDVQQRPPARLKPGVLELLVCVPALKAGHPDIRIIIMIQMVICSCSYLWSVFVFQGSVLINSKMVRHMKNTQTFHKLKSTTVFCINCAATLLTSNFRANMSTQLDSSPCPSLCVTCPEECSAEKYCSMLKPETGGKPHSDCYI